MHLNKGLSFLEISEILNHLLMLLICETLKFKILF